jgi:hypothetical protein
MSARSGLGVLAYHCPYGAIAQLEERRLCKPEVAGSIPAGSTQSVPHGLSITKRQVPSVWRRRTSLVDFARDAVAPLHAYFEEAAEVLAVGRKGRGQRRQLLGGALRHAVALLDLALAVGQRIGRPDAAKLMTALVEDAALAKTSSRGSR